MIGKQISHYHILEKLGEGGMGVVYKAEDTELKRMVAIKFLPPDMTRNEEAKNRFTHEAQAASSLEHHNICNIHEIGRTEDGQLFVVMACYEGETLKEKIERGPLKIDEAVNIAIQVSQGLIKAHEKGIVHRDIKPSNIFITTDGIAKIIDFGLAKLAGKTVLTKEGTTLGTVNYMSPEQGRGEEIDHRTDIWSIGAVLYEMITGQAPFKGEYDQAVIYSIMNEDPDPITALRTGVPMDLERIIDKCLSKDRGDRYQNSEDMIVDLRQVLKETTAQPMANRKAVSFGKKNRWIIISSFAFILVMVIAIIFVLATGGNHEIKSIAVLPLDNLSHNPEQEYFADGMTEALITELSKIKGLKVISRTSVMQYKNRKEHLPDIARELDVDAIVEGSALLINDQIRITAQLIDASTDQHIWSNEYDRKLADVLSLHKEVAKEISKEVKIELSLKEQERLSTATQVNPKAYELVLKGRYIFKNRFRLEDRLQSIEYYKDAIEIDSSFALAYAYLANAIRYLSDYGYAPSKIRDKVKRAVIKSLELDPDLAFAHMQYGMYKLYLEWDWAGAENELKRALELEPNNADIYAGLASYYGNIGKYDKGFEANRKAQSLSPLAMDLKNQKVWLCFHSRSYEKGIKYVNDLIDVESQNTNWNYWLAIFYVAQKDCKKAMVECNKIEKAVEGLDSKDIHELLAVFGWINGKCGDQNKAKDYLNKLLSIDHWIDPGEVAVSYIGLGNNGEAIKWIEKAIEQKSKYCFYIKHAPVFDPLRDNLPFQKLISRINLP
jgi:serine/threonine protein kinase